MLVTGEVPSNVLCLGSSRAVVEVKSSARVEVSISFILLILHTHVFSLKVWWFNVSLCQNTMKGYFSPSFHCCSSPPAVDPATALVAFKHLAHHSSSDAMTSFWRGGSMCLGHCESLHTGDSTASQLANVESYLSQRYLQFLDRVHHSGRCAVVVVPAGLWHRTPCSASCPDAITQYAQQKGYSFGYWLSCPSLKPCFANPNKLSNSQWLSECLNHTASFSCL